MLLQWELLVRIVVQILLFTASAFFSGSETALFAMSRFDLQRLSRRRNPIAPVVHSLLEQPRRLIVSILCGNELVNIAAAANMTAILVMLYGVETAAWVSALLMIPLILLLGEVTPKTLAVSNPVWASTHIVARPMSWWVRFVAPLAFVVRAIADRTTTLLVGPERAQENILHVEELQTLVEEGVASGEISATERSLVNSLIRAGTTEVGEIMTPRTQIVFIDGEQSSDAIRKEFLAARHARVPVYIDHRDNVIGFLYAEDVVNWSTGMLADFDIRTHVHQAMAVPATREVDEMLDFFDSQNVRAALVVSEHGGTEGIVTLTDVTRYLFAGVFDEAAIGRPQITAVGTAYELDGDTLLSAIRRITGLELRDPTMTTIAGLALRHFGQVPAVGDSVEIEDFVLRVLDMNGLQIKRLRLERSSDGASVEDEQEDT